MQKVGLLRNGAHVKRFHTRAIIGELTVGAHSFDALNLLLVLHPAPNLTLIKAMAWHDMGEQYAGDVPSPALWANPDLYAAYEAVEREFLEKRLGFRMGLLSKEEVAWVLGCDKLECYLWAREQCSLGNTGAHEVLENLHAWFLNKRDALPSEVVAFYEEISHYNPTASLAKIWEDHL